MKSYTWNSETLEEYRKDITLMSFKEMVSQIEYFARKPRPNEDAVKLKTPNRQHWQNNYPG